MQSSVQCLLEKAMAFEVSGCGCWLGIVAKLTKASKVPSVEAAKAQADAPEQQGGRDDPAPSQNTSDSLATWTDIGSSFGSAIAGSSSSCSGSSTGSERDRPNPSRQFPPRAVRQGLHAGGGACTICVCVRR